MRISDWSSDVCSSDLAVDEAADAGRCLGGVADAPRGLGKALVESRARGLRRHAGIEAQAVVVLDQAARLHQAGLRQARFGHHEGRAEGEGARRARSEEHTSELQELMSIKYAVYRMQK